MTPDDVAYLLTDPAQTHLAALADTPITDHNHLQLASQLRRTVPAAHAHLLLETVLLRQKATKKFGRAAQMYFDRAGLEMSSAAPLSNHRAQRYAPFTHVTDLCCGLGGDAIGLTAWAHVTGVDVDPGRIALANANVRVYQRGQQFDTITADITTLAPIATDAIFFDPARRTAQGKRIYTLHRYSPPITLLDQWKPITPHWGIKISPGVDYGELPADATVEFISYNGELREAVLWYGDLRDTAARTATLLPSGATLDSNAPHTLRQPAPPAAYLYEPDAAIIRAHLVQHLATQLDAHQIDPTIAYLSSDSAIDTLFATRHTLLAHFPFQLKRLRSYLREQNVGTVTIKKRGSPLDVNQLNKQLRLKGDQHRTLFLTRILGEPAVLVAP